MASQNPYRAGTPVGDTDAFVGRSEILRTVKDTLDDLHRNAMVLYGQRRIGKTSILKQLEALLSRKYCPIFWDWQDKADWTLPKVLEELAQIVSLSLEQTRPTLGPNPQTAFKQWLADQLLNPQSKPLVFLFDEFDVIATSKATKDIISYLGQLLTLNPQHLNYIFAVGGKVEQLTDHTLELFRVGNVESRFISLLTPTETEELIRLSEKNQTLQWSGPATKEIWRLTAGHPYFAQQLCSKVWDHLYQETPPQSPTVTLDHVNIVIPKVLEATESILESLWRSLSRMERVVAAMLAQPQARWPEYVKPLAKIAQLLEQARTSLIAWDLVYEQRGDYRFRSEIIRRWIETHKAFYDELDLIGAHASDIYKLDLIESHASAIYKIAKQLYEEQYLDSAQALLEQAVQLNCYHTKANNLLAEILVVRELLEPARNVLENLYNYNPNPAKEPLVKVCLELAKPLEKNKESEEPSGWFEKMVFWWKSTFSPDTGEEENRLKLYERVLEIDRYNEKAADGKRTIEDQRKAREWRQKVGKWEQRVKTFLVAFYGHHSKRVWQGMGVFLILIGLYSFFPQPFPTGIILEISEDEQKTFLKSVPSVNPYNLESITVSLVEKIDFRETPKFKYGDHTKPLNLMVDSTHLDYGMDKVQLQKELKVGNFEFEYKGKGSLLFTFEARNLKFKKECKASNVEGKDILPCEVKETGFFDLFRGIPWWAKAIFGVIIWIIGIEVWYALKTKEEDDNVVY